MENRTIEVIMREIPLGLAMSICHERSDANWFEQELKSYPKGKTIDVYYDPGNPSDSVQFGGFLANDIVVVVMVIMLIEFNLGILCPY